MPKKSFFKKEHYSLLSTHWAIYKRFYGISKTIKIYKQTQKSLVRNDDTEEEGPSVAISTSEITDASLNARLKSLGSFINNLEPSSPEMPPTSVQNTQDSASAPTIDETQAQTSSQYYDEISERADNEIGFRKLIAHVDVIKSTSHQIESIPKVSAPGITPKI